MSKVSITVFEDAESWLKENLPDMSVDNVSVVQRMSKHRWAEAGFGNCTEYKDVEDGEIVLRTLSDHVEALQLLCEQIGRTLFVGGLKSPFDLLDPGNWDVEVVDAYYQLVFYKKVIYG